MEVIEYLQRELNEKNKLLEIKDKEIEEIQRKSMYTPAPSEVKPPKTLQPATPLPMTSSQFFRSMKLSFKVSFGLLKMEIIYNLFFYS
jgi:hypothetical protein